MTGIMFVGDDFTVGAYTRGGFRDRVARAFPTIEFVGTQSTTWDPTTSRFVKGLLRHEAYQSNDKSFGEEHYDLDDNASIIRPGSVQFFLDKERLNRALRSQKPGLVYAHLGLADLLSNQTPADTVNRLLALRKRLDDDLQSIPWFVGSVPLLSPDIRVRVSDVVPTFMGVPSGLPPETIALNQRIQEYNGLLHTQANLFPGTKYVGTCDALNTMVPSKTLASDGRHLSDAGYKIVGDEIIREIARPQSSGGILGIPPQNPDLVATSPDVVPFVPQASSASGSGLSTPATIAISIGILAAAAATAYVVKPELFRARKRGRR